MSGGQNKGGLLRRFLRVLDHLDREEQGLPPVNMMPPGNMQNGESSNHAQYPGGIRKPILTTTTNTDQLIPPTDKLLSFRALVGIDSAPALLTQGNHERTAENVGIYARVIKAETWATQRYRFFSILINTCLGIQIIVAATLTALGAANGPHSAITAFGAINTIMAGILTYLKGSGLPDRMKRYQGNWRNIREYIEQREREFCLEGCQLDVEEEILTIEDMYERVKQEVEATKSGGEKRKSTSEVGHVRRSFHPRPATGSNTNQKTEPQSPISVPEKIHETH